MNIYLDTKPLYVIKGKVVHGRGIGKSFDMPTANLDLSDIKAIPSSGVYITIIKWNENTYFGVTNVGTRPTVDDEKRITVEAHIMDFDGDLYGETIELQLLKVLREPQKFQSTAMLREQFLIDCQTARQYFCDLEK